MDASRKKLKYRNRNRSIYSLQIILIVSVGLGIFIRLIGIKGMPIGADEYYFYKSISAIRETGLPLVGNSGYYVRGILVQYLIAPLTFIIDDFQISGRIVPTLLNILSGLVLYKMSRKFFNLETAVIATSLFFLSTWQIEFSRYARMYTAFEFLFLASCYLALRLIQQPDSRTNTALAFVTFISIFVFEGAIFLIGLTSALFIVQWSLVRKWHWLTLGITATAYLLLLLVNWRHIYELASFLPEDFIYEYSQPIIDIPKKLLIEQPTMWSKLTAVLVTIGSGVYYYIQHKSVTINKAFTADWYRALVFYSLLLLSLSINQIGLSISILIINYLSSHALSSKLIQPKILHIIPVGMAFLIYVVSFLLVDLSIKQSLIAVLKYPNIFDPVLYPWIRAFSLPYILITTSIICAALVLTTSKEKQNILLICLIVFITVLMVGITNTAYNSTRYTFFLHPLILLLFSASTVAIFRIGIPISSFGSIASMLAYVAFSNDISAHHILNINSESIVYRIPYDDVKSVHLINRKEFKSISDFLERHVEPGDIVISEAHEFDYWYDKPFYRYVGLDEIEFPSYSSNQGKIEYWSRAPLLNSYEGIEALKVKTSGNIWFIHYIHRHVKLNQEQYSIVQNNLDRTLGITNLSRKDGNLYP